MRVCWKLLLIAFFVAAFYAPANAATIGASLSASPSSYSGPCPTVIKFTGTISATNWSPTALRQVQFKFTRSDGALSPTQTLNFPAGTPASQAVSTTWTLGGPGMNYAGWEAIHIVYPTALDSNHADFKIACAGKPQPTPTSSGRPTRGGQVDIVARLLVRPAASERCPPPFTFNFVGTITTGPWPATALRRVDYKFERSDGAFAPVHSIMFPAAGGSQTVTDTWTLSKTYNGWEQLHIIYPQNLFSNKANFSLICGRVTR